MRAQFVEQDLAIAATKQKAEDALMEPLGRDAESQVIRYPSQFFFHLLFGTTGLGLITQPTWMLPGHGGL